MSDASATVRRPTVLAALAIIALLDLTVVTGGTFDLFKSDHLGLVFNSMAINLLHGRFDVDPNTIGSEAFFHDGRTYAYFGIFPALLRFPLVPFLDLTVVHVERLSCWLAMTIGTLAHMAAVLAASHVSNGQPDRRALFAPVLVASILSGPPIVLGWSAAIYHESILWAWALAMVFVALAISGLYSRPGFSTMVLAAMAFVAGLCTLTRPTTAVGLYAALGMILLCLTTNRRTRLSIVIRQIQCPRFFTPLGISCLFVALACVVNYARWGHPLTFADMHEQTAMLALYPDRLPRLEEYGLFNIRRFPLGVIYYFLPVWMFPPNGAFWINGWIPDMFDAFELPPSSFFLSDPLTMFLAIVGVGLVVRGRVQKGAVALVLGLALTPVMMLMAWYMAFRYRAEFMPFLVALSCFALAHWGTTAVTQRTTRLLWLLCIIQIASAQISQILDKLSPFGPSGRYIAAGLQSIYFTPLARALGLSH